MKKHQGFKLGLLAAGIAASVLVPAANGQTASRAGGSDTIKGTPAAQDQRTPVVSLTGTTGDVGAEIFDGKTPRYSIATLPKNVDDAIVYIDVDSPQWNTKQTHAALKLARDLNWPVMAESATWDVQRLHAFLATHFPGINTKGLKNTAVRVGWDKGRAVATDLSQSMAAVEVGIDYKQTSEGQALSAKMWADIDKTSTPRDQFRMSTRATAPGSLYAWFANEAYVNDPSNRYDHQGRFFKVSFKNDVLKVWDHRLPSGRRLCIVGWRGSLTPGDFYRDAEAQFGTAKAMQGDTTGAKFGHGFIERLKNQVANITPVGCQQFIVTGHSLGGAMAQLYAFRIRASAPVMETYNSARVGNMVYHGLVQTRVNNGQFRLFCRNGDVIHSVPESPRLL